MRSKVNIVNIFYLKSPVYDTDWSIYRGWEFNTSRASFFFLGRNLFSVNFKILFRSFVRMYIELNEENNNNKTHDCFCSQENKRIVGSKNVK